MSLMITGDSRPLCSSDAGRYVEIYNPNAVSIDLSSGYALQRWTNGNVDPQEAVALTGSIEAGGFYIVTNNAANFSATYGFDANEDIGTGGPADSNGDDNIALLGPDGNIMDMFGVPGEDGSGTAHEFEDGRAERACGTMASSTWVEADWNIDNDSGGGDGNQFAPEGFDPGAWIGTEPCEVIVDPCADVLCADGEVCVDGACIATYSLTVSVDMSQQTIEEGMQVQLIDNMLG